MSGRFRIGPVWAVVAVMLAGCAQGSVGESGPDPAMAGPADLAPVAARAEQNRSFEEAAKIYGVLLTKDPGNRGYLLGLARNLR